MSAELLSVLLFVRLEVSGSIDNASWTAVYWELSGDVLSSHLSVMYSMLLGTV